VVFFSFLINLQASQKDIWPPNDKKLE